MTRRAESELSDRRSPQDGERDGERDGVFPGWWVVTGCFIVLTTSSGLGFYGLAVYLNAFSNERDWEVSALSLATTFFFFVGGITGVLAARLIATYDVRVVIAAGSVLAGAALVLLGQVEQQWQLFVVYGIFAAGWSLGGLVPATTVVTRWFHRKRSIALSIASTGLSAGGILITPAAKWMLDREGLASGTPWLGLIYVVGTVPFALALIKPDPAAAGWHPDGERIAPGGVASAPTGTPYREALASRFFIGITIGYILVLGSQVGAIQQLVKLVEERTTPDTAAFATLVLAATSVVARLIGGRIATVAPMTAMTAVFALVQAAAAVFLAFAMSTSMLFAAIILFGATIGNILMLQPLLIAERFGVLDYPRIYSRSQLLTLVGTAGGPLLARRAPRRVGRLRAALRDRRGVFAGGRGCHPLVRPDERPVAAGRRGGDVTELVDRSAVELASMIRAREISARELLAACLDRIDAVNPTLNAVVTLVPEMAEDWADEADERTAAGDELGVLHGLPIAHKDLESTAGIRTTLGSPIFADNIPAVDGLITQRYRAAGAVLIGKTNTPEFGAGSNTFNAGLRIDAQPVRPDEDLRRVERRRGRRVGGGHDPDRRRLRRWVARCATRRRSATWSGSDPPTAVCRRGRTSSPWSGVPTAGSLARTVDDLALQIAGAVAGPDPRVPISLPEPGLDLRRFGRTRPRWRPRRVDARSRPARRRRRPRDALAFVPGRLESLGCRVSEAMPELHDAREIFQTLRAWHFELSAGQVVRRIARAGEGDRPLERRGRARSERCRNTPGGCSACAPI